jgi:hypothetical protein
MVEEKIKPAESQLKWQRKRSNKQSDISNGRGKDQTSRVTFQIVEEKIKPAE